MGFIVYRNFASQNLPVLFAINGEKAYVCNLNADGMKTTQQKLYPTGIQTFSKIRERNYLYIDKTEYVYRIPLSEAKRNKFFTLPV